MVSSWDGYEKMKRKTVHIRQPLDVTDEDYLRERRVKAMHSHFMRTIVVPSRGEN